MFNRLSRQKYFCGLDVGTNSIKAALVKARDEHNLDLLGVFETPSSGLKNTAVSDLTELSESMGQAVAGLSQKFGLKVDAVHLGISSQCISVRRSSAVVPLVDSGTKVISRSDILKVDRQARLLGMGLEDEVIHEFPQHYKVDDVNTAIAPRGLYGRKLESNLLLFLVNAARLRNFIKAVHQAGFEAAKVSLSSWAAFGMVMSEVAKKQGCVGVDIGTNITTLLFFKDGLLVDVQTIPWGGYYLSQTLAERLSLPIDLAEDIKKRHADASDPSAVKENKSEGGDILVKREKGYLPIRRQSVCEAVNWEVENLLAHLEAVIKGSPLFHDLNAGMMVVGGGALLTGLMERMESRLNLTVKMGTTQGLNQAALFAGAIGLAQMGYLKNMQETIDLKTPQSVKQKIMERMRELCQEYF